MKVVELCSVPVLVLLCYVFIEMLKRTVKDSRNIKNAYPLISALFGAALGIVAYLTEPAIMITDSVLSSALAGMVSGLSATGSNEILQRMKKNKTIGVVDDSPARYYITGDKHCRFDRLIEFCETNQLRKKDVIVILGDSGFNYYGDERDDKLKSKLSKIKVTLFCLHGNKEKRPQNIATYGIRTFCGGTVYYEPKYPNLFFAKDGETYTFNGKEFMVVGGAHSVDKQRCLQEDLPFWDDEMPSDDVKRMVEQKLEERGNKVYGLLTHTCPISCLPTEMFVSTRRTAEADKLKNNKRKAKRREKKLYPLDIDRSTEQWLETIKEKADFSVWFCGHYHVDKEIGDVKMVYREILPFCVSEE